MKTILLHFTLWCLVPFGASLGIVLLYYTLQSLKRNLKKNFFLFTGTKHGSFSAIFTEYLEGSSSGHDVDWGSPGPGRIGKRGCVASLLD